MSPEKGHKIKGLYEGVMMEISLRFQYINQILAKAPPADSPAVILFNRMVDYEAVAMGFRKIGELIVFANLVGHEEEYAASYPSYGSEWNMGRLINRIKAINPNYYPVAARQVQTPGSLDVELDKLPSGEWLTEDELIAMNGRCADLIHGRNPFSPLVDYSQYDALFNTWGQKISALLSEHSVFLAGDKYMIFCIMNPDNSTIPQVAIFEDIT